MDFFISSLITSMREMFEAMFVFIAVFSVIIKTNKNHKMIFFSPVAGATAGLVFAISVGVGVHYLGNDFSDDLWFKIVFDTLMLISTVWFIVWMIFFSKEEAKQNRNILLTSKSLGFTSFTMVFISFFREGMETVAFTFQQANAWGIFTGCVIAIIASLIMFFVFNGFKVKYLMMVLMIFLIMATSPIIGKFADDLIYKGDVIYRIPNDSSGMKVLNSFLRGLFGIKTSSTALALALQLSWDITFISLVIWKEMKNVSRI